MYLFVWRLFPNYIVITQFVSIRDYYGLTTFKTFIIDKRIRPYPFTKLQKIRNSNVPFLWISNSIKIFGQVQSGTNVSKWFSKWGSSFKGEGQISDKLRSKFLRASSSCKLERSMTHFYDSQTGVCKIISHKLFVIIILGSNNLK